MTKADWRRRTPGALFEAMCVRTMAKQHAKALEQKLDELEYAIGKLDNICAEIPLLTLAAASEAGSDPSGDIVELVADPAEALKDVSELLEGATHTIRRLARALVGKLQCEGMTEQQATQVVSNVFGVDVVDGALRGPTVCGSGT